MKLLVAGYREWAIQAFNDLNNSLINENSQHQIDLVSSKQMFDIKLKETKWDVIALVGWSWIIPDDIVDNTYMIAFHPSDLPKYAGGSPIQNQIIDGVTKTKATLFKVTSELDSGPILDQIPIDLKGSMVHVFDELSLASSSLLLRFIKNWPNIKEVPQPNVGSHVLPRRKPNMSKMTIEMFENKSVKQLYDFIRALGDPYPNAYIEDEEGKLFFKHVTFESKK